MLQGIHTILQDLSEFDNIGLFIILLIIVVCLLGFIAYKLHFNNKMTEEINKSVNNKQKDEPTLREAVMEIRKDFKSDREDLKLRIDDVKEDLKLNIKEIDRNVKAEFEDVRFRLGEHERRINKLSLKQ